MLRLNVLGGLYLTTDGPPPAGAAAQPRRLAVLALLAAAGPRGTSREAIIALLWPDHEEERGRHALTQSLYALRHDLAREDLVLGQQLLRLNPDAITTDIEELRQAHNAGDALRAVECWRGPFLDGFHLPGAEEFERWVEEQRAALGQEFGRVLERGISQAIARGDRDAGVALLQKHAVHDPFNAQVTVRLMEALAARGQVALALKQAEAHGNRFREELELPPDREVLALASRLRAGVVAGTAGAAGVPASPYPDVGEAGSDVGSTVRTAVTVAGPEHSRDAALPAGAGVEPRPARRGLKLAIPLALLVCAILALVYGSLARRPKQGPGAVPVIAIGRIADYTGMKPATLGEPLGDMLATNLARSSGLRVISTARMLELIGHLAASSDTNGAVSAAARQAGAGVLVDGALFSLAPNQFRLDLRRVDLATGAVVRAYRVEGPDLFTLADSGTAHLVAEFGAVGPEGSLAEVSTSSVEAYRLYEAGLYRFYNNELTVAERLFGQALELDPKFAQAAYYYARATTSNSRTETLDRLRRAVELAKQAGDRERLVIEAEWAAVNSSPALLALAETLMVRYPEEVEGYYRAGQGAVMNGDYARAVAPFQRVLALDSLALGSTQDPRCRACDAYAGLATVLYAMDSVTQMRQLIRDWVRRRPGTAAAWRGLAQVHVAERHIDSALLALRVADSLEPGNQANRRYLISVRANNLDYDDAERLLRSELEGGPIAFRRQAQWDLAVILRQVGRYREALELAHGYRLSIPERVAPGAAPFNALQEAQILFELGELRSAAALFDSIAVGRDLDSLGTARDRIWAWAHEADVLAALGDTARLSLLADSMELIGKNVLQARERRLYGHVRGLLARVRGEDEVAEQWFLRSMVSPVVGLTRTNYELAGIYIRTGRPVDAGAILGSALRAGTVGPALYITHTELQARAARAFAAAGHRDSALYYYRAVAHAWEGADPVLKPRRDSALAAIRQLEVSPTR